MGQLVSRRALLVTGVGAGGLLAVGGVAMWPSTPAQGALVLSQVEMNIVERIAAVFFPEGIFPVHGGDGWTSKEIDRLLGTTMDKRAVVAFRGVLKALEWGTLVSRGTRFSVLSTEEAGIVLDVWASENPFPRRIAFDSLNALLGLAFLRRPEVVEFIGWRAGCFG